MTENAQEKELKAFGFTGKLRTGLVTAIISIQFLAIVALWRYTVSQSKDKETIQKELYERVITEIKGEVKSQVKETVEPSMNRLDTVTSKLDSATVQLKEKINNGK